MQTLPPFGTFRTPNRLLAGLWAIERPKTRHWGSGIIQARIEKLWGTCSVIFGKQDQVEGFTIDNDELAKPTVVADWAALPFRDGTFVSGYWDPPYLGFIGKNGDVHYNRLDSCFKEMCRVLQCRITILSPLVYPCPTGWKRDAIIGITFGPNKIIRCLQGFINPKANQLSMSLST